MPKKKYNPAAPSEAYDRLDYNALRNSQIPATLAQTESMRFDSDEDASVFFARELDYIKKETYDVLYPEFTAVNLFPFSSEVDPGAQTITYYGYEKVGFAKIIHNYATDLPRTDIKGKPATAKVYGIGDSFGYSIEEMRASRYAGKSLDVRKGESARYAIDRKINQIAWAGDKETGLMGVLSEDNNVPIFTLPLNAGGTSTKWVDKTPEEILKDIAAMQAYTATLTKSVERPDTLAIPTDAYLYIANTPRSDSSDKSILTWILENSARLKNIVEAPELNADSGITPYSEGNTPQGVGFMFSKDPRKFTIENPLPFFQHPIQPKGLEFEIPCEAKTAGALIYYPLSMLIIPGI
ncbi:MAG: DUF2184 domain-containing protein [Oscillospiraceae bacterium]|nr:DUF2184 domain-containing protein [Oscillospiraceae bacterium]